MPEDTPELNGLDASAAAAVSPPMPAIEPAADSGGNPPPPTPPPVKTPPPTAVSAKVDTPVPAAQTKIPQSGNADLSVEIEKAAHENGIPTGILHAQARQESHFQTGQTSSKGAEGVMQLMPKTAKSLGVNSTDPTENIHGGAKYLKQLHDRFGSWDKALAAYNWGPTNLHAAIQTHGEGWLDAAPHETQKYVHDILAHPVVGPVKTSDKKNQPAASAPEEPSMAEKVWEGAKNLVTTGTTTGDPAGDMAAIEKEQADQAAKNKAEFDQKEKMYQENPEEYKKEHPVDYYFRQAHKLVTDSIMEPALQGMAPEVRAQMEPRVRELVNLGNSLYGLPAPAAGPESPIKQGIVLPEGGLAEEGLGNAAKAEIPQNGILSQIPGAITIKPPVAMHQSPLESVPGAIMIKPPAMMAKTEPAAVQQAVEASGGHFKGQNKDGLVEITLPRSMTDKLPGLSDRMKDFVSISMPEKDVTAESVKTAMDAKFKDFGGRPQELHDIPPQSEPKKLPDPKENRDRDLTYYSPVVYRESSIYGSMPYISPRVVAQTGGEYLANTPELATGQGNNKGILMEFDSKGIKGQVNFAKPMARAAYDQGNAEFVSRYNNQKTFQDNLRAITIKKDAVSTKGERMGLKTEIARFEKQGWTKTENPDGSVTYRRPDAVKTAGSALLAAAPLIGAAADDKKDAPVWQNPNIARHIASAWKESGNGQSTNESSFVLTKDHPTVPIPMPLNNDFHKETFSLAPGTTAIFHTHPDATNPEPSDADKKIADARNIKIYVISSKGLSLYDPATKKVTWAANGAGYLPKDAETPKQAADKKSVMAATDALDPHAAQKKAADEAMKQAWAQTKKEEAPQ